MEIHHLGLYDDSGVGVSYRYELPWLGIRNRIDNLAVVYSYRRYATYRSVAGLDDDFEVQLAACLLGELADRTDAPLSLLQFLVRVLQLTLVASGQAHLPPSQ